MITALVTALVGAIITACILTPLIYSGIEQLWGSSVWPYSRVFNRIVLMCVIGWLLLVRRRLGLHTVRRYFSKLPRTVLLRRFLVPAALAAIPAALLLPLFVGDGALLWSGRGWGYYVGKMLLVLPAAVLISLIEETFFRAVLFGQLRERLGMWSAALLSSLIYAVVHFIYPIKSWSYPGFSFTVGFEYLFEVFGRLSAPGILSGMIGLFIVGLGLCVVLHRTGSLLTCIALHSGWVIALKLSVYTTISAPEAYFAPGVGRRYYLVAQPEVWGAIVLTFVLVFLFRPWFLHDAPDTVRVD